MKLLIDNQLPFQLAVFLRWRGHDCAHVLDVGLDEATDLELWTRCVAEERIVVSKDEDFVVLIWVRLGNCRNAVLLAKFEAIHDEVVAAIESGQRIVEVR
jgi:predicted nuclease of predicted toxin-antitoxin system